MLLPWTMAGLLLALGIAGQVSLLSLGEETAVGLGGRIRCIQCMAMTAVLILTGSAVAIAGPISFVGLVVPHGVRFLAGALLVVTADVVSRLINPPFETPAGAVTALIGVPFFLYLTSGKGGRR